MASRREPSVQKLIGAVAVALIEFSFVIMTEICRAELSKSRV